jgi:squalene-hopene/tetraprenyl-beta-curcumene cyclase
MAVAGLCALLTPRPEAVQKSIDGGLAWLLTLQREDGSIHDGKLANYITSASILALSRGGEGAYEDQIARARAFLQRLQNDEGEGYSEGDLYYGGIGYGSTERPDLSNLQMALEALSESGLEEGDETYAKALRFLQRCQNRSESNDLRIVDGGVVIESGNDGGAGYLPGDSKAGFVELEDGRKVPRSYGSMTYALLKCYVLAGLDKDDPRMKAAFDWCRENYTLDVNPGFQASSDPRAAYQGLFYYFLTMAQALDGLGAERIVDGSGREHAWRSELSGRLVAMQSKVDGSWINHNSPRWYEGNPVLATAYALLTLREALTADAGDGR